MVRGFDRLTFCFLSSPPALRLLPIKMSNTYTNVYKINKKRCAHTGAVSRCVRLFSFPFNTHCSSSLSRWKFSFQIECIPISKLRLSFCRLSISPAAYPIATVNVPKYAVTRLADRFPHRPRRLLSRFSL